MCDEFFVTDVMTNGRKWRHQTKKLPFSLSFGCSSYVTALHNQTNLDFYSFLKWLKSGTVNFRFRSSLNQKSSINQTSFSLILDFGKVQFLLENQKTFLNWTSFNQKFTYRNFQEWKPFTKVYWNPNNLCYFIVAR